MAAMRPGNMMDRPAGRKQEVLGQIPNGKQHGMAARQQQYGAAGAFDGWSAHVRYFLARYPLETRTFVAQRLATYGIRSLLSSHRQEDLTLDALATTTDAADMDVLAMMKQHARGRQKQKGGREAAAPSSASRRPQTPHLASGNVVGAAVPRAVLRERGLTDNIVARQRASASAAGGRHRGVAGRPDVLKRYPFVDDLAEVQGGGVGGALHRATPTTPLQNLAKREIRRLAHEAFRELKASALGIRLSDLPSALQFLFFGDSASLLTGKEAGGAAVPPGAKHVAGRTAKDVHLVMYGKPGIWARALARECLPPTLALAARDTSTLSSASTQGGAEAGWARDGKNMFISEQRWIKVVAHVVRRLWDMDGNPNRHRAVPAVPTGPSTARPPAVAAPVPFPLPLQQPVWRPAGGGGGVRDRRGCVALDGGRTTRLPGGLGEEGEEFKESFLDDMRSETTGWGSAASGVTGGMEGEISSGGGGGGGGFDDDDHAFRAWEEEGSRDWVGAGRSLAWAPPGDGRISQLPSGADGLLDRFGHGEERGGGGDDSGARQEFVSAAHARRQGRGDGRGGRGSAVAGGMSGDKEGTRPAGMWEVTPPPHVAAMRRGRQARGEGGRGRGGGERPAGPAYLRRVQSRIAPQVGAHRERLRKIADARSTAVRDVVARRRLGHLDGVGSGVDGGERTRSGGGEWDSRDTLLSRGHTSGEHALDIAGAFLEGSLMTRLAGGDWYASDDGDHISAEVSSTWEVEGAARAPGGVPKQGRGYGRRDEIPSRSPRTLADNTRRGHTGWLGDFGPVHTHTVREAAHDGEEGSSEEEDGLREGDESEACSGKEERSEQEEKEQEAGRNAWQEDSGVTSASGVAGSGGAGDGDGSGSLGGRSSDAEIVGVDEPPGATTSTPRGGADGGLETDSRGRSTDVVSPRASATVIGRRSRDVGDSDGAVRENRDGAEAGDDAVGPLGGGLDAYLQLASDSGGLLGDVAGAAEGGAGTVGSGEGSGGSAGGYTGATTGSWWEEDRSALEVGESGVGGGESSTDR